MLQFRILGPLEVSERDAPLSLGGAKQRAVLAILLLHRGEAISSERMIDELWGERPPATAAKTLQGYVFHLRRALGDGVLHTRRAGYELELAPGQLDAAEFQRLAAEGRAAFNGGDPAAAARWLRDALALWRGPPLADFAYESFAQAEIARLQEARLAALEDRIDADLALGRQEQLVGELHALVREFPLRERLRAQLMLALYRSGRQVESLAVYREAREALMHELGLEPGRSLQELEQAMLRQDPELEVSARRPPRPRAPRRAALLIGTGGLLLACAAVAAGIAALTAGGRGDRVAALGSGVAAIDPGTGRLASLTETETAPSNVAVGERAVWVLNTEDTTISRIDPKTKKVVKRFGIAGVPSDIAAGEGALWVGNGGGPQNNATVSISRVDPRSNRITRTVRLPDTGSGSQWPSVGFPGIAVGAGAVWAINPDQTVSRIDSKTGRRVATVDARASTIAAGDAGVWFVDSDRPGAVTQIDPRTNRVGQTIPSGANVLLGIAVGAGSVWATGENEGLVWRIDPGAHPVTRSIDTGTGVSFITFGDGMVWAANWVDGKVSRIDPHTNAVTAKVPIGPSQAIAAGEGSVWVSVAGAASNGTLPASSCADVVSGGRTPDVLIASDNPLQGPNSGGPRAMTDAIRLVFEHHGFRAGKYTVGYQSCDASTAQSDTFEFRKCAANANAYARAKRLVAVIGPYNSQCATVEMPILNRAPGGPLAEISPSNSYPGLTRPVSLPAKWGGSRNEPNAFYPTGVRHYVRLAANDDFEGVADAILAKRLGLSSAYLLDDGQGLQDVWITNSFRRTARRLDIRIAGAERFDPAAKSYDALAEKIARSGAQGVVIGGDVSQGGDRLLTALRARLGPRTAILTGEGFTPVSEVLNRAGRAALGLYVSTVNIPGAARELSPAARQFLRDLGTTEPPPFVLEAGQAAELVLQAIARSDGTRASVLKEMRAADVKDGLLGSFHFNRNGDITPATVMIVRITATTPPGSGLDSSLQGAVVDRIVKIPASLAG